MEKQYNPNESKPKRSKVFKGEDAAEWYERCGEIAFENEKYQNSDIYYEWARLEREKLLSTNDNS